MSGQFSPLHAPFPLRDIPLRSIVFLPRPLTAPLCSTRFSGRSAPFSSPLTLRSHALPPTTGVGLNNYDTWHITKWMFFLIFRLPEVVVVVNMAAKHRFPGSRVGKISRCRISADLSEADLLEFGADVATRVDCCARHFSDFRQIAGNSDSDTVNIL